MIGGLGNQMFEYAMGLSIARKQKTRLKINVRAYRDSERSYRLDNLSITSKLANIFEIFLTKKFHPKQYFDELYWLESTTWKDWMSEKNFLGIENIIREEFSLKKSLREKFEKKNSSIIQQIKESDSVSIHIRRTDYLDKQNTYIILKEEYYKRAIVIITEKVKNPRYFFFSDDIEWVKKNFPHKEDSIFLSNEDYEDLTLMSLCKHNIIANSTFSWWGAWLNKNPDKIIVAPTKWLVKETGMEESLIPQSWIKI